MVNHENNQQINWSWRWSFSGSPNFAHIYWKYVCPCRVVVVSNYTKTLDLLQDLCVHMGYTFCRLDGHTPTSQRQRLVDSFNSPYSQNFLFLLSSKAGGVGLNLVGASHLVLYDIDWNPANDIQVRHTYPQKSCSFVCGLFCLACTHTFRVFLVLFKWTLVPLHLGFLLFGLVWKLSIELWYSSFNWQYHYITYAHGMLIHQMVLCTCVILSCNFSFSDF